MKLLREQFTETTSYLVESKETGEKNLFIEGICILANEPNRNKRIYPKSLMESEVARYLQEDVINRRAYGELNHPETPTIDLERSSHLFTELKEDGNTWIGKAKVLSTPVGKVLRAILEDGGAVGFSTRGAGNVRPNSKGLQEVYQYRLATAGDAVANPSVAKSVISAINESADWVWDGLNNQWIHEEVVQQIRKEFDKPSRVINEQQVLTAFDNFMKSLKNPK